MLHVSYVFVNDKCPIVLRFRIASSVAIEIRTYVCVVRLVSMRKHMHKYLRVG